MYGFIRAQGSLCTITTTASARSVDRCASIFYLCRLCDGLGTGRKTLYFEVEVYDRALRRRALGSFSDLYQLALRGVQ